MRGPALSRILSAMAAPDASPGRHDTEADLTTEPPFRESSKATHWLADWVYGTIATLVAVAGLTFETNPGELTSAGVVIVGAMAIWFAHTLSRLVSLRSMGQTELRIAVVQAQLRSSWSIVTAAIPATIVFFLAALHLWTMGTAFVIADAVGVLALAVVGIGTVGERDRPLHRRVGYVAGLVLVGLFIVLMEAAVHLL